LDANKTKEHIHLIMIETNNIFASFQK